MKNYLIAFLLCAAFALAQSSDTLTNQTVINMVLSGVPAGTIIRTIVASDRVAFTFLPGDLDLMQRAHVPEDVFKAMAAKSAGRPVPGQPLPAAVTTDAPAPAPRDEETKPAHTESLTQRVHQALKAKEKPTIEIQVVDTLTSQREYTQYIPGTAGSSATNCNGNATVYGTGGGNATINGTQNCTTTTNPGRAPSTVQRSIEQTHVQALMPDGRHITLWCQQGFRRCAKLTPGSYSAELEGNSVWMKVYDLDGTTTHKIKYRFEGGW